MTINNTIGIEKGFVTTIHSYTGDQNIVDSTHKDLYRSRAGACSIVPTKTGAAKAISEILPELAGKLDGTALRVPTPNVSAVDMTFISKFKTTSEELNSIIKKECEGKYKNIVEYTEDKIVSIDVNHSPYASVFHSAETKVVDGNMVRVLAWYDNEWGFTQQLLSICKDMAKLRL